MDLTYLLQVEALRRQQALHPQQQGTETWWEWTPQELELAQVELAQMELDQVEVALVALRGVHSQVRQWV